MNASPMPPVPTAAIRAMISGGAAGPPAAGAGAPDPTMAQMPSPIR